MAGAPADAETETAGMAWTKAIDRMRLKADVDGTIGQGLGVAYGEDKPDMPVKGRVWYYHIKKGWTAAGDWKEVALYKDKGIIGPAPHPLRDSSKYKANRALATPKVHSTVPRACVVRPTIVARIATFARDAARASRRPTLHCV